MDYGMILSIESSCDDSSIAITDIKTKKLLFHKKISQDEEHSKYGGVVPEIASRLHTIALPKILEQTKEFLPNVRAIAVTNEPGLVVSLVEGVAMAKALSVTLHIPLIPVNHLLGHVYSLFIEKESILPLDVVLVSGGHTQYMRVNSLNDVHVIAKTLDDSFGESFDKAAKMLGLGYPGGPKIEEYAARGNDNTFALPIALQDNRKAFSYSGLKNALRLQIEKTPNEQTNLAASFQKAAVGHLIYKLNQLFREQPPKRLGIVGGASANKRLRNEIDALAKRYEFETLYPDMTFCADNAAMIGRIGIDLYRAQKYVDYRDIDVASRANFN